MIKFEIKLGDKALNSQASDMRELLKPLVKGMHCTKCTKDTIITFTQGQYGGLNPELSACCNEFETRVRLALGFQA